MKMIAAAAVCMLCYATQGFGVTICNDTDFALECAAGGTNSNTGQAEAKGWAFVQAGQCSSGGGGFNLNIDSLYCVDQNGKDYGGNYRTLCIGTSGSSFQIVAADDPNVCATGNGTMKGFQEVPASGVIHIKPN